MGRPRKIVEESPDEAVTSQSETVGDREDKKLVPLVEHEAERAAYYREAARQKPMPNGIGCPKCGAELDDIHPGTITETWPPKKAIACKCGFRGWRIL